MKNLTNPGLQRPTYHYLTPQLSSYKSLVLPGAKSLSMAIVSALLLSAMATPAAFADSAVAAPAS